MEENIEMVKKLSDFSNYMVGRIKGHSHYVGAPILGGDPEFFIINKQRKVLNSDRFFPGKNKPIKIKPCISHTINGKVKYEHKLFFDGIQAEMAPAPSFCREYLCLNFADIWKRVFRKIGKDHNVVFKPAVRVSKEILDNADPEARRFGCMPDFNAYTLTTNTCEMDASRHLFRYAGGHIHIGASFTINSTVEEVEKHAPIEAGLKHEIELIKNPEKHIQLIKLLDLLVGIPTLSLDNEIGSKKRRAKYGKAGCFRPTPYGIEYRTPSCWWLKSPITVSLVYGLARLAWLGMFKKYDFLSTLYKKLETDELEIKGIIDEGNIEAAESMWLKLRPYVLIMDNSRSNPIHIYTYQPIRYSTSAPDTFMHKHINSYPRILSRLSSKNSSSAVFGIAVFEFIRKYGLNTIIDKNPRKEWDYKKLHTVLPYNLGFISQSQMRLEKNKDFMKFQSALLTEIM